MRRLKSKALCLAAAVTLLQACVLSARGQVKTVETQHRLFIPWTNLALDVELRGLLTEFRDTSEAALEQAAATGDPNADGGRVREFQGVVTSAKDSGGGMGFLRIRMEPVKAGVTAEELRAGFAEQYPKTLRVSKGSVKQYDFKETPLLRFTMNGSSPQEGTFLGYIGGGGTAFPIPYSMPGLTSTVQVLEAFMVRDGTGFFFRFASPRLRDKDVEMFHAILDSVRFVDASKPSSSYDYFMLGEEFYQRKQYAEAIAALGKAVTLEHKQRALTQPQWRQLVMALANTLGADDAPERARDILEYGVAQEPTYPYFHHGLSRLYAYFGDLDRTLSELEKTYQLVPREKNFFVGRIPDPLEDPAFVKFAGDPRFRDGVKALKKKYKN